MNIEKLLDQSERWLNVSNSLLNGKKLISTKRARVAAGLYHLSKEHHGGIFMLASNQLYGSAFALLRPQFESYVRGVWCQNCASEDQLQSFVSGKEPPLINELLENIQTVRGYDEDKLRKSKDMVWRELCGYTHGGIFQVAHRNTEAEIAANYPRENVVGLLIVSATIAFLGLVAFARLLQDEELVQHALVCHQEIFGDDLA